MSRRRALGFGCGLLGLFFGVGLYRLNTGLAPYRVDPLVPNAGALATDERLDLARKFAPIVYHEFHLDKGRQDVPAPVDFDGDLIGDDNWEDFPHYELVPTVYYTVLETKTHYFLTYHLFHPRDWTTFDVGLHLSHENDGENLQVVVEKETERPILLVTQAHYRATAYGGEEGEIASGSETLRGFMLLANERGVPLEAGTHAGVFVESGGHGIYGALDARARVSVDDDGNARFRRKGWVLVPAREGEKVLEPELVSGTVVPYQLESTLAKLLPGLLSGDLIGPGGLFDGIASYAGRRLTIDVPRYYEADRFSGPFGPDRGISPFAFDFHFGAGSVGALFFDPAVRYPQCLQVPEPWSLEYIDDPLRPR